MSKSLVKSTSVSASERLYVGDIVLVQNPRDFAARLEPKADDGRIKQKLKQKLASAIDLDEMPPQTGPMLGEIVAIKNDIAWVKMGLQKKVEQTATHFHSESTQSRTWTNSYQLSQLKKDTEKTAEHRLAVQKANLPKVGEFVSMKLPGRHDYAKVDSIDHINHPKAPYRIGMTDTSHVHSFPVFSKSRTSTTYKWCAAHELTIIRTPQPKIRYGQLVGKLPDKR